MVIDDVADILEKKKVDYQIEPQEKKQLKWFHKQVITN